MNESVEGSETRLESASASFRSAEMDATPMEHSDVDGEHHMACGGAAVIAPSPSIKLRDYEHREKWRVDPVPVLPLCGRSVEKAVLSRVYKDVVDAPTESNIPKTSFVLIEGPEGIGKTYLLQKTLKERAESDGVYFISCRFDQFRRSHLTRMFDDTFEDFVQQCCARGADEVALVRQLIHESDELDSASLREIVPCMKRILGPDVEESTSSFLHQSARRSGLLRGLLQALSEERPVILCVDNLQWTHQSTNDMLLGIISPLRERRVLLVATCRPDRDSGMPGMPGFSDDGKSAIMDGLCEKWKKNEILLERILLEGLSESEHAQLVSYAMQPSPVSHAANKPRVYQSLSNFVFNISEGNPLFTCELLHSLRLEQLVSFSDESNQCLVKIDEVGKKIQCNSLYSLLQARVRTVSSDIRQLLKTAAALGLDMNHVLLSNAFSEATDDAIYQCLEEAVSERLLERNNNDGMTEYKFLHNSMQHAFYSLTDEEKRASFHFALGRQLWKSMSEEELQAHLPTVVVQFVLGSDRMTDQSERYALASLLYSLAATAAKNSSFVGGSVLLQKAMEFLGKDCWRVEHDLTLAMYNTLAEAKYAIGDFEGVDNLVTEILAKGRSPMERLQAHCVRINKQFANNQMTEALEEGLRVLRVEFDLSLPSHATRRQVMLAHSKLSRKLKGLSDEYFFRLPPLATPSYLARMKIMNLIITAAHMTKPLLTPLITMKMIDLTVEHGTCSFTSVALAMYGMFLCSFKWNVEEGYRYGQLALKMLEKYRLKEFLPRVHACVFGEINGYTRPTLGSLRFLRRALSVAMETGDVDFAMVNCNMYCLRSFFADRYLPDLAQELHRIRQNVFVLNQKSLMSLQIPFLFTIQSLVGITPYEEGRLAVESYTEADIPNHAFPLIWLAGQKCMVAFFFKDYENAAIHASKFFEIGNLPFKPGDFVGVATFGALSLVSVYPQSSRSKRSWILKRVNDWLKTTELAAKYAPDCYLSKYHLLKAELAALKCKPYEAYGHYTIAIALASKNGLLADEAVANERAGRFMLEGGGKQPWTALTYYEEALEAYRRWGAKAKAEQFETELERLRRERQADV